MKTIKTLAVCVAIAGMALSSGCATVKNKYHVSDLGDNKAVVFASVSLAPHDGLPCPEVGFVFTSKKGQQGRAADLPKGIRPLYFVETYDCQAKDVTTEGGRKIAVSSMLLPEGDYAVSVYVTSTSYNDSRLMIKTSPLGSKLLHVKAKSVIYLGEAQIARHVVEQSSPNLPNMKVVGGAVARINDRLDRDQPLFFSIDKGLAGSAVVNAVSSGDYFVGVEQSQTITAAAYKALK